MRSTVAAAAVATTSYSTPAAASAGPAAAREPNYAAFFRPLFPPMSEKKAAAKKAREEKLRKEKAQKRLLKGLAKHMSFGGPAVMVEGFKSAQEKEAAQRQIDGILAIKAQMYKRL